MISRVQDITSFTITQNPLFMTDSPQPVRPTSPIKGPHALRRNRLSIGRAFPTRRQLDVRLITKRMLQALYNYPFCAKPACLLSSRPPQDEQAFILRARR